MKYIKKGLEPNRFTIWKKQANAHWTPSYDKLSGPEKQSVFESLLNEQGHICCYCERELQETDFHIEHLNPQERGEIDPLDFSNMLCSCQRVLKKKDPRQCGNAKGHWYEPAEFISPLDQTCESKFKYTYDGQIHPMDINNTASAKTISVLKLDSDKLNDSRRRAIEPFLEDNLSEQDLQELTKYYLDEKENNNGRFKEFYTTIKFLFG